MNNTNRLKSLAYILLALAAGLVLVPLVSVFSSWSAVSWDLWNHLLSTSLLEYTLNTIHLAAGVFVLAIGLGVFFATVTTYFEFPGRKYIAGLAYSTLVFPPYVMGFVLMGMFEYSGSFSTFLRLELNIPPQYLPEFKGIWGAIVSMSVSLFPYVYMLTKLALQAQGQRVLEAGRSLGLNVRQCLMRIAVPLVAPAILMGGFVVLMEVLADFGTVSVFSVDTFTTGIYKAWFGFFDLTGASQLASLLITFMFMLYFFKNLLEKKEQRYQSDNMPDLKLLKLAPVKAGMISAFSWIFFTIFLFLPILQLIWWASSVGIETGLFLAKKYIFNSVVIAATASFLILMVSSLSYTLVRKLRMNSKLNNILLELPYLGYAFPGAVLAAGLVVPLTLLYNFVSELGIIPQDVVSISMFILLSGLFIRFFAVGGSTVKGGYKRLSEGIDEAAQSMGLKWFELFYRVHLPVLKKSFWASFLFCFIDVIKEMPLTLMSRPIGWDTLAVKIWEWTSEGEWEKASLPALILIGLGFISIWLMVVLGTRKLGGKLMDRV